MTVIDNMKEWNIDKFIEFLDAIASIDDTPWIKYFNDNYCSKCKPIRVLAKAYWDKTPNLNTSINNEIECAPCELKDKNGNYENPCGYANCSTTEIIKLWLNSEVENNDTK